MIMREAPYSDTHHVLRGQVCEDARPGVTAGPGRMGTARALCNHLLTNLHPPCSTCQEMEPDSFDSRRKFSTVRRTRPHAGQVLPSGPGPFFSCQAQCQAPSIPGNTPGSCCGRQASIARRNVAIAAGTLLAFACVSCWGISLCAPGGAVPIHIPAAFALCGGSAALLHAGLKNI
jgi:hypothetical protein